MGKQLSIPTAQRPNIFISILSPPAAGPYADPATVTIAANVSTPIGQVTKVEFFEGNTKLAEDLQAPFRFTWNNIAAGNYTITARATNDQGETRRSNSINFSVYAAPTVSLVSPSPTVQLAFAYPVPPSTPIPLLANAADKDGSVVSVEFFDGPASLQVVNAPPYFYGWSGTSTGNHTITAVATDNDGNTTTSLPVVITVNAPPAVSINVASASGSPQPFAEAEKVTVTASATAPPVGSIVRLALFETYHGDKERELANTASNSLIYVFAHIGPCDRELKAVATSDNGVIAEYQIKIAASSYGRSGTIVPNGINVGQTKLFDQRSLALMLQSMQSNLANRDFFNQASVAAAIGKFQGARLDTSSLGVNVTTTPLPGVTTITNTGTPGVVETVTQPSTPAGQSTAAPGVTTATTTPSNTTQQTVTQPAVTPAPPQLPTQNTTFTFQPAFDLAPQTLLASQIAMNFEIVNLRLLLEGALSDQLIDQQIQVNGAGVPFRDARARAIAGFRISLDSLKLYKKAVAEVEITIRTNCDLPPSMQRPPSLVSLVPMENNFNVATVSKDAKQFGLGVAVQPVSFGVASQRTKEQLYLIQDQDVVAFEGVRSTQQGSAGSPSVTFGWQFRPVLGQEAVRAGARQVYASLALPVPLSSDFVGIVEAHTYWRYYDSKKKTVGSIIPDSDSYQRLQDLVVNSDFIRGVALQPRVDFVDYQDAGQGKVMVWLRGANFLPGTQIIVGDQVLDTAEKGLFIQGEQDLRFFVSAQQLALSNQPRIVGRFGPPVAICKDEFRLDNGECGATPQLASEPEFGLKVNSVRVVPVDAQNSRVTLLVSSRNNAHPRINLKPIVLVGGTPYGLGGVPLVKRERGPMLELTFNAPTQSIRDAGKIGVKALFLVDEFSDEIPLSGSSNVTMTDDFTATSVIVLAASETEAELAIIGSNFSPNVKVRVGGNDIALTSGKTSLPYLTRNDSTLLVLHLKATDLKFLKQIVVHQGAAQPIILPVTPPPTPVPKPKVTSIDSVLVNDENEIKVQGANLTSVDKVLFRGSALEFKADDKGVTGTLRVSKDVTETPGNKTLDFVSKDGSKVTGTLIVNPRPGSK